MNLIRSYIIAVLCAWPLLVMSQSRDFEIRDFHENLSDLTAATSNVKDLNGVTAALIRFSVRDRRFTFDANNGIIKQENDIGEVRLYVPVGTKRITIRHPKLGILRDYEIPCPIRSRVTYDAEIIILDSSSSQDQPKERRTIEPHFHLGAGLSAVSITGPTISAGLEIDKYMFAIDYTLGLDKVDGVGIYYLSGNNGRFGEAYDYSVSRLSLRFGFCPKTSLPFQIVPQVGTSFNMIRGKEVATPIDSDGQFGSSTPVSLSAAVSFRVRLSNPLNLYITPQYSFVVGAGDVYKVIKEADSKIKSWGEGFGVSAGLMCRF